MKWFLGLVLVVALITGAAYGVGLFLLPNTLTVTRTVDIERPRAAVFAMINDLRIVKEWSPYYARDPDAEYVFSGEAGEGQSMRWTSQVSRVGNGRMSVVRTEENRSVDAIMELDNKRTGTATLNARLELAPVESATRLTWTVSAECQDGYVKVPCRYMSLILRSVIQTDLDSGLTRLKTLTEQLPNVDFEDLRPEIVPVEPRSWVYSPVTTSIRDANDVNTALALGLDQVNQFMSQYNLTRAGQQVRVTTAWDQAAGQMSFRVGYPFSGPTPLTVVGVQIGQTPSGRALRVTHEGPRAAMRNTYAKIYAFLQAHRIPVREDGLPWEVIEADAGDGPTRIDIFVPLQ